MNKLLLNKIKKNLISGKPIMLYDFSEREDETDLVYYGPAIKPTYVKDLRLNAGAPITVYIDYKTAKKIGLFTFVDLVKNFSTNKYSTYKKLVRSVDKLIDARFSLSFDFRKNKTGCSHLETSRTIKEFASLIGLKKYADFPKIFKSPGHVPLIIASKKLIKEREGHSEMLIYLTQILDLLPLVVASEMIHPSKFRSMTYNEAKEYAKKRNLIFLEGKHLT